MIIVTEIADLLQFSGVGWGYTGVPLDVVCQAEIGIPYMVESPYSACEHFFDP